MVFYHPGVYQDVVHVNSYMTLVNEIFEDVIHYRMEGSRAVGEAKEHDQGFEEASICLEGGLPLVSLFDPYIVISHRTSSFVKYLALESEIQLMISGMRGSG